MLPDFLTHGRIFCGMLTLPPLQVVEIAAEDSRRALDGGNANAIGKSLAAFAANAPADLLRFNRSMPGNSAVSIFVETGGVNGANGFAGAGVPVLAVRPMIGEYCKPANLAERHVLFVGRRVAPDPAVAAIEAAGAAVVRSAVGQVFSLLGFGARVASNPTHKISCSAPQRRLDEVASLRWSTS
jgi:hypothetical protein